MLETKVVVFSLLSGSGYTGGGGAGKAKSTWAPKVCKIMASWLLLWVWGDYSTYFRGLGI